MVDLHLIRHGETDGNRDRRVQGSSDVPLNDTGRAQARAAAARFAALAARPTVVVTSDLARASETGDILAGELGLDAPRRRASLRERGYGEAEGMRAEDVVAKWGDWAVQQVPGAEPWEQVRARGVAALGEILQGLAESTASVSVVSHGALIRQVVRHITDGRLPAADSRMGNLHGVRLRAEGALMHLIDASWTPALS